MGWWKTSIITRTNKIRTGEIWYILRAIYRWGAFFLYLQPEKAVINDFNSELAITWKIVRDNPKELLALLTKYSELNSKEFYLDLRIMDRNGELEQATDVERAARFIYMIKT